LKARFQHIFENVSLVDIVFALPLLWGAYKGFRKGLIVEVFSLLALIFGVFCAIYFPEHAQQLIETNFQVEAKWIPIIAFSATFIVVVILVNLVGKLIEKLVDILALGFFNKLGGLAFGVFKTLLILSFLVFIFEGINKKWQLVDEDQKQKSILYLPLSNFSGWVIPLLTDAEWVKGYLSEDDLVEDETSEEIVL
jgi:membrane protein required for colicin V production